MKDLATVVCLLMIIGFVINTAKEYYGTHSQDGVLRLCIRHQGDGNYPPKVKSECHPQGSLPPSVIRDRKLAHVIETPVVTKPAVSTTPLYFQALQHLKITSLHQHKSYQVRVSCLQRQWPTFSGGETTYRATAQLQS